MRRRPRRIASSALDVALASGDTDLELRALAQLGLAEVTLGEIESGLARLDEAMAAATSGEPASLETFADICCTLMLACERAGDSERPQQWSAVLDEFVRSYDHVTLLAFCRTCCADVYRRQRAGSTRPRPSSSKRFASWQRQASARAASRRRRGWRRSVCSRDASTRPSSCWKVSSPSPRRCRRASRFAWRAASRQPRRRCSSGELDELGWTNLLAAPLLAQLVETRLAEGGRRRRNAPRRPRSRPSPGQRGRERVEAVASPLTGRIALRRGTRRRACMLLQEAVNRFAALGVAPRRRSDSARTGARRWQSPRRRSPSIRRRHARTELEALGALRDADAAAARSCARSARRAAPGRGRSGSSQPARDGGVATAGRWALESQIGERLFISPKTVEHHVSRIYSKLGRQHPSGGRCVRRASSRGDE